MGNICPGSNRRGTSRDISNANSNRSSIMQSINTSIFHTSHRPKHDTNSISHNNGKNSNHVINGNNNYNAPTAVPYNVPTAVPYNAPPAVPATHVEVVNSRSLPPVVVSEPATVAPPVPIIISEPNNETVKINHNDNPRKPQSQNENQNKNVNVAQNETSEVKTSQSVSVKTKHKGSKKPHHRRTPSAAGLRVEFVLNRKTEMMKDVYTVGKKLGQGQFGTTYLVTHRVTGNEFACKSINKRKLIQDDDVEDVKREIQIMHHVCGHPNIISIEGAYEDNLHVHVVMELCTGGELFDRIIKRGHYSEKRAAELARVIVGVVEACHSLGVMHRDLKPENFLFVNEDENAPLKAIDFGLSIFFKPDQIFNDVVGSPYYVAPEVLRKCYGPEADVWSAGVIIYILLCGVPPFWAETEQGIFEQVLNGKLDFESEPWPNISESAKDLVRRILVRNPKKRLTAHEVLCHPWLRVDGVAPDKPLDSAVLSRLKQFSAINNFKKMALKVIAENLSEEEIAGLKEMFKMIDTDNSGQITFEELKAGLARVGAHLDEPEVKALMEAADIDNSGTIDYAEFVAATMHWNKARRNDYLLTAFEYFDRDRSGYITRDELQKACEDFGIEGSQLEDIIQEVDQNNDGQIDYSEFVAMMNKGDIGFSRISSLNQSFTQAMRDALNVGHSSSSSTDSDDMEYDGGSTLPHKTTHGTTNTV